MTQTSRLVLEIDSRDAEQKAADVKRALEALESQGIPTQRSMARAAKGLDDVGESSTDAAQRAKTQRDALAELLGSIDPVTRRLGELDKQEKELAKNRKLGLLDKETFDDYQGKINATRTELGRFNSDMTKTGMSAKATAAAMRNVPAQFTDIVVSLQAGQAPFTVLLQQGGQLKDMFGGIGPAAKALGGYVWGLVGPLTAAAASAAALGAVFVDAEREISAFNRALFSGSASSGQTVSTLTKIAKSGSVITGSMGEARAAVIALAGSSRLSEVQFTNLAQAAASIGEFTGKSAGEVAAQLGGLGDSATKAAQKISAQYGLLTSEQYNVIKGLEDQGRKQEALDLLSETLNKNAQARFKRYRESLSDIERDWNDIGTAISNAYSQIRGELFPDTAKEIEIIERILKTRRDGGIAGAISTGLSNLHGALGLRSEENDDSTAALEKRLAFLKSRVALNEQNASAEGKTTRENQAQIEAQEEWSSLVKSNYSAEKRLAEDISKARKLGLEAGRSQLEIDKAVADIQAKYDKAQAKPKAIHEDSGQRMLDEARQRYAVLQQQSKTIDEQEVGVRAIGAEGRKLLELEQQISDLKTKGTLTASQKQVLAMADLNLAQQRMNAALEKENQLKKVSTEETRKLLAFQQNLNAQLANAQTGLDNNLAGMGLGDQQRQRLQEQLAIQQQYQQQMDNLLQQRNEGRITQGLYDKESEALRQALDKRLAMQGAYYTQVDRLQSDWTVGATSALATYQEQAADVAGQTRNLFSNAFGNMEDAVVNFVRTGKLSFKDFADQVIADLIRIQVRQAAAGFLNMAISAGLQMYGGGASGLAAGSAGAISSRLGASAAGYSSRYGFSSGGYTGPGGVNEPAGIVHKGEVVWSQDDIKRAGGVQAVEGLRNGNVSPTSRSAPGQSGAARTSQQAGGNLPPIIQYITAGSSADEQTLAMIKQAARQGAQDGYNLVLRDLKTNGPARQMIARNR